MLNVCVCANLFGRILIYKIENEMQISLIELKSIEAAFDVF
jgi:hypothetical protein